MTVTAPTLTLYMVHNVAMTRAVNVWAESPAHARHVAAMGPRSKVRVLPVVPTITQPPLPF